MKKVIVAALALLTVVGCLKTNDPEHTWQRTLEAVASTENTSSGIKFDDQIEVTIIQNNVTAKVLSFELRDIQFVPMMPSVNFMLVDVPFTLYDHKDDVTDPLFNSWVFNVEKVIPQVGGVERTDYAMHNFKGNFSDTGLKLEFDVNFGGAVYHATIDTSAKLENEEEK